MAVLRRRLRSALAGAILLLAAPAVLPAEVAGEYEVKAAFLYNFTKFVEWPSAAFADERSSILICVLGENPFGRSLSDLATDRVAGRKLTVLGRKENQGLDGCHVLFISRSERGRIPEILAAVQSAPVLTVADTEGFLDQGGGINFMLEGSKVRFEINQEAAERAGIRISSKLMSLARRVKSGPGPA